jgi:hypothetical protein
MLPPPPPPPPNLILIFIIIGIPIELPDSPLLFIVLLHSYPNGLVFMCTCHATTGEHVNEAI